MTDKTDMTARARLFSVTIYNEDEIKLVESGKYPDFISSVTGGLEEAPTTGKIHYQCAISTHVQQRCSKIKKWLPTAHIQCARNAPALLNYVMKAETAVGEKKMIVNTRPYFHPEELLLKLAEKYIRIEWIESDDEFPDESIRYNRCVRMLLEDDLRYTVYFMDKRYKNFWLDFRNVYISRAIVLREADEGTESVKI